MFISISVAKATPSIHPSTQSFSLSSAFRRGGCFCLSLSRRLCIFWKGRTRRRRRSERERERSFLLLSLSPHPPPFQCHNSKDKSCYFFFYARRPTEHSSTQERGDSPGKEVRRRERERKLIYASIKRPDGCKRKLPLSLTNSEKSILVGQRKLSKSRRILAVDRIFITLYYRCRVLLCRRRRLFRAHLGILLLYTRLLYQGLSCGTLRSPERQRGLFSLPV